MDPKTMVFLVVSAIGTFTMIVSLRRYEYLERMSMIERGMNPADMKLWSRGRGAHDPYRNLRLACTVIGVGVGLVVGNMLRSLDFFDRGGIVAGLVCICGGAGLLVGYFMAWGFQKGRKEQTNWQNPNEDTI